MNRRQVAYLAILVVLLGLIFGQQAAQAQDLGPNLLVNPGFEEGHYNQDGIAEITVPNGWRMHWSNNERIFGGEYPTARPETVVWNIAGAPAHEAGVFWRDGIYTVKIFKGWAPVWAAMSQDVSGLQVGRRYRLTAPIYIDLVEGYDGGNKVPPSHNDTGRVRLGASPVGAAWRDEGAIAYSGWWTAATISPFYQAYPIFVHDFTATQANMTIWIEMASSYPYQNNGFFVDTVGLYALNETAAVPNPAAPPAQNPPAAGQGQAPPAAPPAQPAGPTPTPRADGSVVHVVQSGDTMWAVAFQYAETLGMTAEEALPHIQELNNNPAFLTVGQELLIKEPTGEAVAAADEDAEDASEGDSTAAATPADGEVATTPEATAEGDAVSEEGATTDEAATEATPEAASETELVAPAAEETESSAGGVCVTVYDDANGDAVRDSTEGLLANAAVTLSRAGNTISTYITDGTTEPYCFEVAEADTYQVQIYPPADYASTGEDTWAVAVTEGAAFPVSFGLQSGGSRLAVVDTAAGEQPAEETAADPDAVADTAETAETTEAADANTGFQMPRLGMIVLGVAVLLVVLAGIGVFLLRRG